MRNVFDQYEQPENKLTHALMCTLDNERSLLLLPFLRWLGIKDIPKAGNLHIVEQQVPGSLVSGDEDEARGLPDACIYSDEGWAVLYESKVLAHLSRDQLNRHVQTAKRHGFERPQLVVLTDDGAGTKLPQGAMDVRWREIYSWFGARQSRSAAAETLVNYMEVLESQMITRDYAIRGTITMFNGLRFGPDSPYTYPEGRRCIRLLGDELQKQKDLREKVGVDPKGKRRGAITGRGSEGVWDYLPLKIARGAAEFTHFPHLTLGINSKYVNAAVTVPNSVKGGFKKKLHALGAERFVEMMAGLEKRLRPVIKRSRSAKPIAYITQRH
jgi:hypothetical protein